MSPAPEHSLLFLGNLGDSFFFSCQIALARTSSKMPSSEDEGGHPCFILLLGKGSPSFTAECDVSPGFLMNALCHANKIPLIPSLLKEIFFVMKRYAMNFVKCLPGPIEMTQWLSLQVLLILCITSIGFPMLSHSCLPSINPVSHGV